jgi:hypothetical protein
MNFQEGSFPPLDSGPTLSGYQPEGTDYIFLIETSMGCTYLPVDRHTASSARACRHRSIP